MKKETELRQTTILFVDISGFTAMSEKINLEEITSIMNSIFKMMGDIIEHNSINFQNFPIPYSTKNTRIYFISSSALVITA